MKRTGKCPKCGSTEIIKEAKPIDEDRNGQERWLRLAKFRNPGAMIFKGKQSSTVAAWVCADCGYTELYTDNPQSLRL